MRYDCRIPVFYGYNDQVRVGANVPASCLFLFGYIEAGSSCLGKNDDRLESNLISVHFGKDLYRRFNGSHNLFPGIEFNAKTKSSLLDNTNFSLENTGEDDKMKTPQELFREEAAFGRFCRNISIEILNII